ncbi:MAG: multiple sugar transport system ATP-binding protein [Thermoleophilales bacterium]|nr:multiple sugar transport system ATP-binding protein [Thermoleophilales bacterium]
MADIRLRQLGKRYGDVEAVKGIDLDIPSGEVTVLVGPSGGGKTTTLRMIAGLEEVTAGSIEIGEHDVTTLEPKERDVAMVFQNYALYPHMSVRDNIGFGLRARKLPRKEIDRRVDSAAGLLGVEQLLGRKPGALSGGQQQRVAIGRAIVREPAAFLFDEPLSNLDAKLRVEMRTEILKLQRELGATVVHVTHDQEEAMTLAHSVVVMSDGRIVQRGTPAEVYSRPATTFVARFIGSPEINLLPAEVATRLLGLSDALPAGASHVGIRPEDLRLTAGLAGERLFRARVRVVELLGANAILTLRAQGDLELRALVDARALAGVGEGREVDLHVDPSTLHVFGTDERRVG